MRKNLHRWMLEYAVLHDVPAEEARKYADPELLNRVPNIIPEIPGGEEYRDTVCLADVSGRT